jgi:hypothetical protein
MAELAAVKSKLLDSEIPDVEAKKFLAYVADALAAEAKKKPDKPRPVTSNDNESLYRLFIKFWALGLTLDGTNVVIAGRDVGMVTFHGYKNTVLRVYPETQIDFGLVREGDQFSVAKESGSVIYTHTISDPFGNSPIIGAYVVIKTNRGEYIETLNQSDYDKMRDASKQPWLWDAWESEFWLKSVMKRACKRHFYDIVADLDKEDNAQFGMDMDAALKANDDKVAAAIKAISEAATIDDLKKAYMESDMLKNPAVVAAKDARKAQLAA